MSNNNAKSDNYDAAKEMMKINNIDIPKEEWRDGVLKLLKTTDNIIHENDENKELYRDYKQLNIDSVRDFMKRKINQNKPIQILDNMNDEFKSRAENFVELSQINIKAKPILDDMLKKGHITKSDIDKEYKKTKLLFRRINNFSIIDVIMFSKEKEYVKIKKDIKPHIMNLIRNLKKDDLEVLSRFLRRNNILYFKNRVNFHRLIAENRKIMEIFGVKSNESLDQDKITSLNEKLTITQEMKDEFNEKLSKMTQEEINANINDLLNVQVYIMALENMTVYNAGFKHLGLFTSDISNAISNNEMKGSNWSFNTARIDNSKRAEVIKKYKGEELVQEYSKLMLKKHTVNYEILELVPKWYNMIHGGARKKEAIIGIRSEIGGIMDKIKEGECNKPTGMGG